MFLIKENEKPFMLWWKFLGSILGFTIVIVALITDTLYIPSRQGFLHNSDDPSKFQFFIAFCILISTLSLWQGGYGLYRRYFNEQKGDIDT